MTIERLMMNNAPLHLILDVNEQPKHDCKGKIYRGRVNTFINFKGEVIYDKNKPDGQFRKPSDNSKIKNYLPNFKFTPLYEGLKETIDWFEGNYNSIRK